MNRQKADLLIKNCAELATPLSSQEFSPANFQTIEDASVAAYQGRIVAVGRHAEVAPRIQLVDNAEIFDATDKTLTPGFVDCHTHPVFNGAREDEFEMRVLGKSYEEIAIAGGGIRSSVRNLRQASKELLLEQTVARLDRFLSFGTTTLEAKSGYGLTLDDEVKMLEVISEADRMHSIDLVPTFLGAHEIPDEYRGRKADYIDLVVAEMIPRVIEQQLAEFCDVFCESHVFSVDESAHILASAKGAGLKLKIHSEQLTRIGGTVMAARLGATSADHLDYTSQEDWEAMGENKVVPVLLPGAVFFLGKSKYAEARKMLDFGLPVALATDLNPGSCMTESMPMMLTLACLHLALRPSEALTAATYHAALAIDRGNLVGSIEVGKKADLVIWNCPNHKHLPYHFGVNLVKAVVKSGKIVCENRE